MCNKNTQIFICAMAESGAKHYLAVGRTKLQMQDLESWFSDAPTAAILKALDGMQPVRLVWIELEWIEEKHFSVSGWTVSKDGVRALDSCRMSAREMRIGELADIVADESGEDEK